MYVTVVCVCVSVCLHVCECVVVVYVICVRVFSCMPQSSVSLCSTRAVISHCVYVCSNCKLMKHIL